MARRKRQQDREFAPEALDALIGDTKTPEEFEALFRRMKKGLAERILNAELTQHLGYAPGEAKPATQANHRKGSTPKTVLTDDDQVTLAIPRDRALLRTLPSHGCCALCRLTVVAHSAAVLESAPFAVAPGYGEPGRGAMGVAVFKIAI